MAIQQDWLLRIIERLGEALGKMAAGESAEDAETVLEEICGLDLARIDALPAPALRRLLSIDRDRSEARLEAVARALDGFAAHGDAGLAEARRAKARALRIN